MASLSNAFGADYDAILAWPRTSQYANIESLTKWLELEMSFRPLRPKAEKRSASDVEASDKSVNNGRGGNGGGNGY